MGSKTRLGSCCTKRANNGVNLVTSQNINTRLACPIAVKSAPSGSAESINVTRLLNSVTHPIMLLIDF